MPTESKLPDLALVVQSVIAIVLVVTLCAMMILGLAIPELLLGMTGLILGYYFGTRQQASLIRGQALAVRSLMQAADSV